MPDGGELTIQANTIADCGLRIADLPQADPQAATSNLQSAIELSLIDTGKGMPPEVVAKVFQPFFSTKPGGTGLGLPTARKIIVAHGGTIDVQSEVGHGTKFTIRLPAAPFAAAIRNPNVEIRNKPEAPNEKIPNSGEPFL
jgi:signal transduction histidine kinase